MKNLNFMTPLSTSISYGIVGTNLLVNLVKAGVKVSLFPIGPIQCDPKHVPLIQQCLENAKLFDPQAPCLRLFHQFSMAERVGRGEFFGYVIFELDQFNQVEKHHLSQLDMAITCSHWGGTILDKLDNVPYEIVPLGVDREIFNEDVPKANLNIDPKATIFSTTGKWEIRKINHLLCDIFNKAFTKEDNVHLIMASNNPFLVKQTEQGVIDENKDWCQLYKNSPLGDKISCITNNVPNQSDIAQLMSLSDCLVQCSLAEGWSLPLLEGMSCGKHVITTNYSGQTEFCNKENSFLVEPDYGQDDGPPGPEVPIVEEAFDGKWFFGQGKWLKWGENQANQLIQHLRNVHKLKQEGKLGINKAGIETAKKFSWENSVKKLLKVLY